MKNLFNEEYWAIFYTFVFTWWITKFPTMNFFEDEKRSLRNVHFLWITNDWPFMGPSRLMHRLCTVHPPSSVERESFETFRVTDCDSQLQIKSFQTKNWNAHWMRSFSFLIVQIIGTTDSTDSTEKPYLRRAHIRRRCTGDEQRL